jgi:hypothetical protein
MKSTCNPTTVLDIPKPIPICPTFRGKKVIHRPFITFMALFTCFSVTEIIKYTWSKTDKAIVDQIREALDEDKYPLFVAEGSSESKAEHILHNAYLHKALRSFESCCGSPNNAIVIFGHSLAINDQHILRCISAGGVANILISLYGNPTSETNKIVVARAGERAALRRKLRGPKYPLSITFYKAETAKVWG